MFRKSQHIFSHINGIHVPLPACGLNAIKGEQGEGHVGGPTGN